MYDNHNLNADKLDLILEEAAIVFPASADEIKAEVEASGAPTDVMLFFEEIQPDTRFDSKAELLNMAEQRTGEMTKGEADPSDSTIADDEIF